MAGGQYPGGLDSFTANTDDVDDVLAADINELQVMGVATQTELGTDPAGSCTDVKTRLAHSINDAGMLEFDDCTELTIAGGVVTATQNYHKIDTQGDDATDDLDTINGHSTGLFIILRNVADARNVVIKHNTGNILCASAGDITLDVTSDVAFGIYDNGQSKWLMFRGSSSQTPDLSGTPADSYVAIWKDTNTLEGTDDLQWDGTTLTIGDGTAARDYILKFNGADADGIITWMEDEDYFTFSDDIYLAAVNIVLATSTGTKIGTATNQKLGFFNATPVVQQTELTDELTTITHTAAGTPDYALQDLIDSGAGSAFGFATKDEGNTVMAVIANLQARVNELETKLVALGLLADAD